MTPVTGSITCVCLFLLPQFRDISIQVRTVLAQQEVVSWTHNARETPILDRCTLSYQQGFTFLVPSSQRQDFSANVGALQRICTSALESRPSPFKALLGALYPTTHCMVSPFFS